MYRKVMFSTESGQPLTNKGKFHEWGTIDDGYSGYVKVVTCAIVEDVSGNVHALYPWQIKFVEEWPS